MSEGKAAPVRLSDALAGFDERWAPRAVASLNDYLVKVVKLEGEFVWHAHQETDELFMVLAGELDIELRDGVVHLEAGDLYVVPAGVEHRPVARAECHAMLIEPNTVINTGDATGTDAAAGRTREAVWVE